MRPILKSLADQFQNGMDPVHVTLPSKYVDASPGRNGTSIHDSDRTSAGETKPGSVRADSRLQTDSKHEKAAKKLSKWAITRADALQAAV